MLSLSDLAPPPRMESAPPRTELLGPSRVPAPRPHPSGPLPVVGPAPARRSDPDELAAEATTTQIPSSPGRPKVSRPVFVDGTGRRARVLRGATVATGLLCAAYVAVAAVGAISGPTGPLGGPVPAAGPAAAGPVSASASPVADRPGTTARSGADRSSTAARPTRAARATPSGQTERARTGTSARGAGSGA